MLLGLRGSWYSGVGGLSSYVEVVILASLLFLLFAIVICVRTSTQDGHAQLKESWTLLSPYCHLKHSVAKPIPGRSCHYSPLLARQNTLERWLYYIRSAYVFAPSNSAREFVRIILSPILVVISYLQNIPIPIAVGLVRTRTTLFGQKSLGKYQHLLHDSRALFNRHTGRAIRHWLDFGYDVAIPNAYALMLRITIAVNNEIKQNGLLNTNYQACSGTIIDHVNHNGFPTRSGSALDRAFPDRSFHLRSYLYRTRSEFTADTCRNSGLSVKHAALCMIPWLTCVTGAAVPPNSVSHALESSMPLASIPQDDNNGWTWLLWPAIITGILIWELATVRLLGQPLLFHGLSMGLFGAGYLLMVLDSRVPFYIQFSTWLGCATRTGMWTYHDTRDLSADSRRIAGLALVILPLLLDLSIISAFASGGDSTTKHIQSAPLLFVAFLLPCVSLSAFVCSCFRAIYKQIIQRNAQVAEQLHVV